MKLAQSFPTQVTEEMNLWFVRDVRLVVAEFAPDSETERPVQFLNDVSKRCQGCFRRFPEFEGAEMVHNYVDVFHTLQLEHLQASCKFCKQVANTCVNFHGHLSFERKFPEISPARVCTSTLKLWRARKGTIAKRHQFLSSDVLYGPESVERFTS